MRVDRLYARGYNGVMKKTVYFVCMAMAFLLVSCDDEPVEEEKNPFVGTWENESNGYRIGFTKTVATGYYPSGDIYWTGTYTYDDTHITVKLDQTVSAQDMVESHGDTFAPKYRFEDVILVFNGNYLNKIL